MSKVKRCTYCCTSKLTLSRVIERHEAATRPNIDLSRRCIYKHVRRLERQIASVAGARDSRAKLRAPGSNSAIVVGTQLLAAL